jgi:hypothetical protein
MLIYFFEEFTVYMSTMVIYILCYADQSYKTSDVHPFKLYALYWLKNNISYQVFMYIYYLFTCQISDS